MWSLVSLNPASIAHSRNSEQEKIIRMFAYNVRSELKLVCTAFDLSHHVLSLDFILHFYLSCSVQSCTQRAALCLEYAVQYVHPLLRQRSYLHKCAPT